MGPRTVAAVVVLKGADIAFVLEGHAHGVQPFEQAALEAGVQFEADDFTVGAFDGLLFTLTLMVEA